MFDNSRSRPRQARRKSPVQARSRDTVATIMEAAAHVLLKRGYAGFTTNHVAARAGVSIGSIYQYFRDKDMLLAAMLERDIDDTASALLEALATVRGSDPASLSWSRTLLSAWYRTHARPHQHTLYLISAALPGVRAHAEASLSAVAAEITRQLRRRGVNEAALRARTWLLMAMAFVHELVIALPEGSARRRAEREAAEALTAYLRSVV
jgi:AcrR family transcriptional regulator